MPGHATLGPSRQELPVGDYVTQIVDVSLGEREDFNDRSKKKPAFIWSVDLWVDEKWESRKLYTPTYFTDMNRTPKPKAQFISGLNKLVRAVQGTVPQTVEQCEKWDENDLVGQQFIWRVEKDAETDELVRKFLPIPPAAASNKAKSKPPPRPAPPPPTEEEEEEEDPFEASGEV